MRFIIVRPLLLLCAILFLPSFVFAQEAVLTGIITDTTSAVLPGVTVQATHELESPHLKIPLDWSHDGRFLLIVDDNAPQTGRDL